MDNYMANLFESSCPDPENHGSSPSWSSICTQRLARQGGRDAPKRQANRDDVPARLDRPHIKPPRRMNTNEWRLLFLDVGFDPTGIFSRICPLRKGRWCKEEESYAVELVKMVHSNRVALKFRQSMRSFLAQKLHSDEMRV
ncbi:hypothetical protein ACHHYP_06614 [Achlya hypogyna]|uniref:Uncharacterized protein n=1 Tax=Achlya hypogyna TaxID=1202772 RepID=A0A1V9YSM4_ACHHY|nr:hypothetical protein ACHHYP_06614 [Achlya hypogyna]